MRAIGCLVALFACAWAGPFPIRAISDDVTFYLYTPSSPDSYEKIVPEGTIDNIDSSADVKIVVHGYLSSAFDDWMIDMKDAFIQTTSSNVILVDWSGLAGNIDYFISAGDVEEVGQYAASLVDSLIENQGFSVSSFHALGHSLGAHVCGFLGKNLNSGKIARISGLDPAYPGFATATTSERLAKSDAEFVDIIHTNSGHVVDGDLSIEEAIGDVDFYPNGGSQQPGCPRLIELVVSSVDITENSCNHGRSHDLFIDSITSSSSAFSSYPCDSDDKWETGECFSCDSGCNNMGFYASSELTGTFYLATRGDSPYTAENYRILMNIGELQLETYGDLDFMLTDENNVQDGYNLLTHETVSASESIDRVMGFLPTFGTPKSVQLTFTRFDLGLSDTLKVDSLKIFNADGDRIAEYAENFDLESENTVTITLTS